MNAPRVLLLLLRVAVLAAVLAAWLYLIAHAAIGEAVEPAQVTEQAR